MGTLVIIKGVLWILLALAAVVALSGFAVAIHDRRKKRNKEKLIRRVRDLVENPRAISLPRPRVRIDV